MNVHRLSKQPRRQRAESCYLYNPVACESCTQFDFTPPPQHSYHARSTSTRLFLSIERDSIVLGRHSKKQGRGESDPYRP